MVLDFFCVGCSLCSYLFLWMGTMKVKYFVLLLLLLSLPLTVFAILPAVITAARIIAPVVIAGSLDYALGAVLKYKNNAGVTRYVRTKVPVPGTAIATLERNSAKGLRGIAALSAITAIVDLLETYTDGTCNDPLIDNGDIKCRDQTPTECPASWHWDRATAFCVNPNEDLWQCSPGGGQVVGNTTYECVIDACTQSDSHGCKTYRLHVRRTVTVDGVPTVTENYISPVYQVRTGTPQYSQQSRLATDTELTEGFKDHYADPVKLPTMLDLLGTDLNNFPVSLPIDAIRAEPQLGTDLANIATGHSELVDPELRTERVNLYNDLNMTPEQLATTLNALETEHPGITDQTPLTIPTDYARENTQQSGNAKLDTIGNKLDQLHQDITASVTPPSIPSVTPISFAPGWARLKAAMLAFPAINVGNLSGICPTPSFSFYGTSIVVSAHCSVAESVRSELASGMVVAYSIMALLIILRA